jgi:poly-gamma-glutamate capsule biosynthesis protein CapA/YwtB (metallophosphatase superfamily)
MVIEHRPRGVKPHRVMAVIAALVALVLALPADAHAVVETGGSAQSETTGTVRLMAVGDVMLAQSIGRRIVRRGPLAPWVKVKSYFDEADLVVANLECTISTRGTPWPKTFTFRAPPAAADSLVAAGIDVVSLANNHALDYGRLAFKDTLAYLEARGVGYAGGGRDRDAARAPLIVERNGLRLAFLGYVLPFSGRPAFNTRQWAATDTLAGLAIGTPEGVARDVAAVRPSVDLVIVMVHGGTEYRNYPTLKQRTFNKAAVQAGAALVIGHHPHVLQGYVYENRTLIAYSLGNFVFDYFTGAPNDTAILDVTLSAQGVESVSWIPAVIERGFPRPAVGAEIDRVMSRLKRLPPP